MDLQDPTISAPDLEHAEPPAPNPAPVDAEVEPDADAIERAAVLAAQRRRVFEGLPPDIQRNPVVRRAHGIENEAPSPQIPGRFGLGDAVEIMARPFAKILGIKNCGKCKERQDRLNKALSVPLSVRRRRRGPI